MESPANPSTFLTQGAAITSSGGEEKAAMCMALEWILSYVLTANQFLKRSRVAQLTLQTIAPERQPCY